MMNSTPTKEINSRWKRYREFHRKYLPQCEGAFIFSRLNIYYFTGTFANGVFWLPIEGEPILFCRRGAERAKNEIGGGGKLSRAVALEVIKEWLEPRGY